MNAARLGPPISGGKCATVAHFKGVVTDYVGAGLPVQRKPKIRPKRKRQYPGFRIRMLDFYCDEVRAVCECLGVNVREFIYEALLEAKDAYAREIGLPPREIARLDKRQRAAIRHRYCLTVNAISGKKSEGS